jgi:hypothetical protein
MSAARALAGALAGTWLAVHLAAGAAPPVGELWEMRLEMRSASHGHVPMEAQRICQEPARGREDPRQWMGPRAGAGCRAPEVQRSGDRLSWRMQCADGESSGEMRFAGADRLEGRTRMKTAQGDFDLQVHGRKVGACTLDGAGS